MRNKTYLLLALACVLCLSTNLAAKDADAPEKPKAAKKAKGPKVKVAPYMRAFGSAELTEAQKTQVSELVTAKKEEILAIRAGLSELISREDNKKIQGDIRKAVKGGTDKAAAQKAAWDEAGISAEDQSKVAALQKQKAELEQEITDKVVATFSDEQKEAMKIPKKGKGAKGKKGKKGKKKAESEDMEEDEDGM